MFKARIAPIAVGAMLVCILPASPQGRGGGRAGGRGAGGRGNAAAQTPRTAAAIDMTGYWVSVVTEDWMFRMVTPPKGQYLGVPLNAAARRVADAWDPAKDEAAGEQCKSYGAAAVMRVPGRIHVTFDTDTTMKIETEAGSQTRLFHFAGGTQTAQTNVAAEAPSWQGYSVAEWENAAVGRGEPRNGDLRVVTTRMRAGYLRKNG